MFRYVSISKVYQMEVKILINEYSLVIYTYSLVFDGNSFFNNLL